MAVEDDNGEYRTFSGAGFGTLMVRLTTGAKETPEVASSRAYLRNGLPAMYQDGDFGMRFGGESRIARSRRMSHDDHRFRRSLQGGESGPGVLLVPGAGIMQGQIGRQGPVAADAQTLG